MAVIPVTNGESIRPISDILGIGEKIGRSSLEATPNPVSMFISGNGLVVDAFGNDRLTLPSLSIDICLPK